MVMTANASISHSACLPNLYTIGSVTPPSPPSSSFLSQYPILPLCRRRFSQRLVKEAATSAAAEAAVAAARAAGSVAGGGSARAEAASTTEAAAVAGGPQGVASPSAVTLHALRLDWEPLQLRFWPAAVADALLGLVEGGKSLTLHEDECLRPFGVAGGGAVISCESTSLSVKQHVPRCCGYCLAGWWTALMGFTYLSRSAMISLW